jgi:hypothetical protein
VRWETGITDLGQIAEKKMPVRVLGGGGEMFGAIMKHYGLSREKIESWGGRFYPTVMVSSAGGGPYGVAPWVRSGEFDLIMDNLYAAYTPEFAAFYEASVLFNLRFLPLPEELIGRICTELGGEPGLIPYRLARGVEAPTPSVYRPSQLIFGRDDMPEDVAYQFAKALDDRRDLFRKVHIPYSYDPKTVTDGHGIPLHVVAPAFVVVRQLIQRARLLYRWPTRHLK